MTGKLDLETLTRLIEQGEILDHHGEPAPHAPRSILKQQLARLAERGWAAYMAFAATLAAGLHGIAEGGGPGGVTVAAPAVADNSRARF